MFVLSIPLLGCKLYTQYTLCVGSSDQCLPGIMPYEARRPKYSALFPTSEYVSQVVESIQNYSSLKARVTHSLADCNYAWKGRATDKLFQCLGYNCLMSRYSTKYEEGFVRKEL